MDQKDSGLFSLLKFGQQAQIETEVEGFFVTLYEVADELLVLLKDFQNTLDGFFYGKKGDR
jgi:hypothetical protein